MDIRTLRKEGHSIKAIARQTGRSRNTVRRVLRDAGPTAFQKPQRHSRLDAFKTYVQQRWEECGLSAVHLLAEIQPMGYRGSVVTLRRYLQSLKPERGRFAWMVTPERGLIYEIETGSIAKKEKKEKGTA